MKKGEMAPGKKSLRRGAEALWKRSPYQAGEESKKVERGYYWNDLKKANLTKERVVLLSGRLKEPRENSRGWGESQKKNLKRKIRLAGGNQTCVKSKVFPASRHPLGIRQHCTHYHEKNSFARRRSRAKGGKNSGGCRSAARILY